MSPSHPDLAARLRAVQNQIRDAALHAGQPEPTLVAVSKTQSSAAIAALYALGQRDFGENYVQELVEKARELVSLGCPDIRWHFIGHLQSNKAKLLVENVPQLTIHSIGSEKLAQEIAKRVPAGRKLPVLIEVNIDHEASKSGVLPEQVQSTAKTIASLSSLDLRGLMCIPNVEASRDGRSFARLRELEMRLREAKLTQGALSMGMSGDFALAIREGSTHVRVGTALFGERIARD